MADKKDSGEIDNQIVGILKLENNLAEVLANPTVQKALARQREINEQMAAAWKVIEKHMIDNSVKSVKGDWGSVTIAERKGFKVEDMGSLPSRFIKKVPDTDKIKAAVTLEGKLPAGVEEYTTVYLTKHIKKEN